LVIVEQASRILTNYVLLLENALKIRKLAFWGHGKNFQVENANRVSEWMKQKYSTKVHWWFAYNELSANLIEKLGYPRDRITVVQNAIDTYQIHEAFIHQKSEDLASLCRNLEIRGHHVGLYVGGMYAEKRLNFLLDACELIRQQLYDFEMIFVGSGSEGQKVQEAAQKHRWIHYVGPKFGLERVPYFAISQVFLMPGAVGLAILDCFALELPMIAANVPGNGPEIEYLRNDFNGIMVEDFNNPGAYAQAAISILQDEKRRQILIRGCQESNSFYSIEEMVERFACGIQMALEK
jgi:glycosyltransferase involved in cell wall biosynthesis